MELHEPDYSAGHDNARGRLLGGAARRGVRVRRAVRGPRARGGRDTTRSARSPRTAHSRRRSAPQRHLTREVKAAHRRRILSRGRSRKRADAVPRRADPRMPDPPGGLGGSKSADLSAAVGVGQDRGAEQVVGDQREGQDPESALPGWAAASLANGAPIPRDRHARRTCSTRNGRVAGGLMTGRRRDR